MKNLSTIRLATLATPLASLLLAGLLVGFQVNRLHQYEARRAQTAYQISFLEQIARNLRTHPRDSKVAVVPPSPDEQSLFLNTLRRYADASKVQLVRYENRTAVAAPRSTGATAAIANGATTGNIDPNSAEAKANALPAGVGMQTGEVEVAGSYNEVRQFLYALLHSPRLYNTTDLKWAINANEQWPLTHLSFTLTRYTYLTLNAGGSLPTDLPDAAPTGQTRSL